MWSFEQRKQMIGTFEYIYGRTEEGYNRDLTSYDRQLLFDLHFYRQNIREELEKHTGKEDEKLFQYVIKTIELMITEKGLPIGMSTDPLKRIDLKEWICEKINDYVISYRGKEDKKLVDFIYNTMKKYIKKDLK